MKRLFIMVIIMIIMISCAESKHLCYENEDEKVCKTFEPYGLFDSDEYKDENVIYRINTSNIIWCIVFSETIIVPIFLLGFDLYEPSYAKQNKFIKKQK